MRNVTTRIEVFKERNRLFFVDDDSKSCIGSIKNEKYENI